MRWLKHTLSVALLLLAVGLTLATAFSDHSGDYGQVALPQGGTVHLPKGKVTVFYRMHGNSTEPDQTATGFAFQVTPAQGGSPIAMELANGQTSDATVTRSETIGDLGAIAKLEVPYAGEYVVNGSAGVTAGASSLAFGRSAGAAVLERWKLLVGLLVAAVLLAIIPVPRSGRRRKEPAAEPSWSPDPRAPYVG